MLRKFMFGHIPSKLLTDMSCIYHYFQKFFMVISEYLNAVVARREQVRKKSIEVQVFPTCNLQWTRKV